MFRQPLLSLAALVAFTVVVSGLRAEETAPPPTETRPHNPTPAEKKAGITKGAHDSGDTAWMLISTALVMLMVPGLALFYGGLARRKNLLGTMMQSMVALGVVGVLWIVVGYALAFGKSQGGWIGWSMSMRTYGQHWNGAWPRPSRRTSRLLFDWPRRLLGGAGRPRLVTPAGRRYGFWFVPPSPALPQGRPSVGHPPGPAVRRP